MTLVARPDDILQSWVQPEGFGFTWLLIRQDGLIVSSSAVGSDTPAATPVADSNLYDVWPQDGRAATFVRDAFAMGGTAVVEMDGRLNVLHVFPYPKAGEPLAFCVLVSVGRRLDFAHAVAELGRKALQGIPLRDLLPEVVRLAGSVLRVNLALALHVDAAGQLQTVAVWPRPAPDAPLELAPTAEGQVIAGGVKRWSRDRGAERLVADQLTSARLRSYYCLPLWEGDRRIGALAVYGVAPREFVAEEQEFLESVVRLVGQAVATTRLLEQFERFQEVIEVTSDLVTLADVEGRVVYMNPAARRLLGLGAREDLGGMFIGDNRPEWARKLLYDEAIPVARAHGTWTGESAYYGAGGRQVPVSQVVTTHRDVDGMVVRVASIARDITDIKHYQSQIEAAADQDPLTGVPNRRRFLAELAQELAAKEGGALLYIDLDDFKAVNDSLGHHAGDRFLIELSHRLQSVVGESGVFARLGGDELAVLLPGASLEDAKEAAERLLAAVREFRMTMRGGVVRTTASIGIACYPLHGKTVDELLSQSDLAMYSAKDSGRNKAVAFDARQGGREVSSARLHWRQWIVDALAEGRFRFDAQPIVELRTREVIRYELLLRVADSHGRFTGPTSLLEQANQTGLITQVDEWAIRRLLEVAARSRAEGRDLKLSLNLSAHALGEERLLHLIEDGIREYDLDPHALCFEITEWAAVNNLPQAQSFLGKLRGLGLHIALDDFGVGFSSFAQLKNLPVDLLKIDGSFISRLANSKGDQLIVKAMAEVADGLGIAAIAEFVGSEDVIDILKQYGIPLGQGFHLGRPVNLDELLGPKAA